MIRTNNDIECPRELELDLWLGRVIDRSTQTPVASIAGWREQYGILATESFLATKTLAGVIHFLDLTLLWPNWLAKTTYLQDIRRRFDAPRSVTSKMLRPFGWKLDIVDKWECAVVPDPSFQGTAVPIRAARSFSVFDCARLAFEIEDREGALKSALSLLDICGESHLARMQIGIWSFRHGLEPPVEVKALTARKLLEYQEALQCMVNTLSAAWGKEQGRNPRRWAFVTEKISEYEQMLEALADFFEMAKDYLRGDR